LDTAARRFSVAAPRLWNSLPLNCRTAPSVNTFKIRLKTFLKLHHFIFAIALSELHILWQFLAHTYFNKFPIIHMFHILYIIRDGEPA